MAQQLMSPAIGAGEAFSLGSLGLVVFAAAIAGAIGGGAITLVEGGASLAVDEPVGAFVSVRKSVVVWPVKRLSIFWCCQPV